MKIVFMGTPEFARVSLDALIKSGEHEVVAVVTQPDRPVGRGGKLVFSPVKVCALENGLPCLQPERIKTAESIAELEALNADIFVVAAYGQILPKAVLDMPRYGSVNVHASLLPKYRGAAPIQRAVIDGEEVTGITIMQMDVGLDTGDMLLAKEIAITPDDTGGTLHDKLAVLGAQALLEALREIAAGIQQPKKQDDSLSTYAAMLTKETGRINWNDTSVNIANLVRGLAPRPSAWTMQDGEMFKIHAATACVNQQEAGSPGQVLAADGKRGIIVAAGEGTLCIHELQRQNGKRLKADEFLRGSKLEVGAVFG